MWSVKCTQILSLVHKDRNIIFKIFSSQKYHPPKQNILDVKQQLEWKANDNIQRQ